jgi:5'-nucleotidase
MTLALITNDDGIDSPGLHELARAAYKSGLDVVVAAPSREASGSSASISAVAQDDRVLMEEHHLSGLDDVKAFAVVGSPGLIALLATRGAFGDPPHLILSGINAGANAGHAILHSGTVGAAFTGAVNGCRAMAVSLDIRGLNPNGRRHWESAGALIPRLVPMMEALPESTVLNVNVPDVPPERVMGLRRATPGRVRSGADAHRRAGDRVRTHRAGGAGCQARARYRHGPAGPGLRDGDANRAHVRSPGPAGHLTG